MNGTADVAVKIWNALQTLSQEQDPPPAVRSLAMGTIMMLRELASLSCMFPGPVSDRAAPSHNSAAFSCSAEKEPPGGTSA